MRGRLVVTLILVTWAVDAARAGTEADSLIEQLRILRTPRIQREGYALAESGKCGFGVAASVVALWPTLSVDQRALAASLLKPLDFQKDTLIGRFRIHFDTTNVNGNEPALLDSAGSRIPGTANAYVDSVGTYFNIAWTTEIDSMGYTAPPIGPADSAYDIYVRDLGVGLYGETVPYPDIPIDPGQTPPRYTSYIEVHNDFHGFYSPGMEGLKVTAAHEFHHAIQLGSYGFWGSKEIYFHEITSVWMEDVLYNDINDYYQYIKSPSGSPRGHFDTPYKSLNAAGFIEYSRGIWGKYVQKRFGLNFMRRVWEYMKEVPSIPSLDLATRESGSSLRKAFLEFAIWNYFTDIRADTISYYTEGKNYPLVRLKDSTEFSAPTTVYSDFLGVEGLGSSYFRIFLDEGHTRSVIPIASNLDADSAGNGFRRPFQYSIQTTDPMDSSLQSFVVNGTTYWAGVTPSGATDPWNLLHGIGNAVVGDTNVVDPPMFQPAVPNLSVYPNPFIPSVHQSVRFQLPARDTASVELYVFSTDLKLVFSATRLPSRTLVKPQTISWDGRTDGGNYAASGVYFCVLQIGDEVYKAKFVLLRN